MKRNLLLEYSEELAAKIAKLCTEYKIDSNTVFQIKKSSSSVFANITEAQYPQSLPDMLSKFKIARKECVETESWLKLLYSNNSIDEETALTSIYSLFDATRNILKSKGRQAPIFTKVAVVVLNQIIRPFTAKWHKKKLDGAFSKWCDCEEFREELKILQGELRKYTSLLAEIAMVEDLTEIVFD